MKKIIIKIISLFFCVLSIISIVVILATSVRGNLGNPTPDIINSNYWKDSGPFELSPERGRFALTYAIADENRLDFSPDLARFVTPDLGFSNGKYVSLFAPGVSYLVIPAYKLGKMFNLSQVSVFLQIGIIALINALLVYRLAIKLGAQKYSSIFSALVFLFSTPAYAYATTLYQHHISTFLILLVLCLLSKYEHVVVLLFAGFLISVSLLFDYPNFLLLMPVGFWLLEKIVNINIGGEKVIINIRFAKITALLGLILPLIILMSYNNKAYQNPFTLSGTVPGVEEIGEYGQPVFSHSESVDTPNYNKNAIGFFDTRSISGGFKVLFLDPDRSVLFFTPIMFLSLLALFYNSKDNKLFGYIVATIGINILTYSMWGDPWGGWAFGARYLIPSYALSAILLSLVISKFKKSKIIIFLILLLTIYSTSVNTLGALTSSKNPPKIEAESMVTSLGEPEKYSSLRNLEMLREGYTKNFVYRQWVNQDYELWQYYSLVLSSILILQLTYLLLAIRSKQ